MLTHLVVENGTARGSTIPLRRGLCVAGRGSACAIRLPGTAVPREHFAILRVGGALVVVDRGSAAGTLVNGQAVPVGGQVVVVGDVIGAGAVTLRVAEVWGGGGRRVA